MKVITDTESLNQAIYLLKLKRTEKIRLFKDELKHVQDGLNPVNFIKNTFHEVASSPEVKKNLVDAGIGLTTGYLTRKVIFGATRSPIKKILGVLFQFAVTSMVSKHSEGIKSIGQNLLQRFLIHRNNSANGVYHNGKD